ncbi:GNAT family N-acetyltransferase [Psychroflexus salis]|uniref:Acetyltransferase n=1 Tax=Psychroflexus salis TaxID=1526574 RepID=A0A917ECU2_9FLAO|nr:GNAT family N-acetyltransferase [Psychroflexus salis]GGE20103.1 acetyltransferase [Psychroflexus salis]
MRSLKGNKVILRALEPEDLLFLDEIENNEKYWHLSNSQTPFSKYVLKRYLEHALEDIYTSKQLRLVITNLNENAVGFIDLYDFDPKNNRAGVGIIIHEKFRQKGFAFEALDILTNYAFAHLNLHQLYAGINHNNIASLQLFQKLDFEIVGLKKEWNYFNDAYHDEYLLQKIKNAL